MKPLLLCVLISLVVVQSASARPRHRHFGARGGEAGMPITAQGGSIRINSVGEVITRPTPVIQKERSFNNRAQKDLSGKPDPMTLPNPPARP